MPQTETKPAVQADGSLHLCPEAAAALRRVMQRRGGLNAGLGIIALREAMRAFEAALQEHHNLEYEEYT